MPARRIAADDRGLDDQRFPLPRRAQRAGNDGLLVRVGAISRTRLAVAGRVVSTHATPETATSRRAARTSGTCCGSSSCGTWASERYSAKRRAESFSHAHARMATKARPAGCGRRVPRSNQAGTPARVSACSSSADVPLRRADEHRHLVERHAAASLLQDPARDLDRFASFAWRGEELDVAARLAFRRLRRGEQIAPQRDEIVVSRLLAESRAGVPSTSSDPARRDLRTVR